MAKERKTAVVFFGLNIVWMLSVVLVLILSNTEIVVGPISIGETEFLIMSMIVFIGISVYKVLYVKHRESSLYKLVIAFTLIFMFFMIFSLIGTFI